MCEPHNVERLTRRLAQAQYLVPQPQRERNPKSAVLGLSPMTAIPEDIFPYEAQSPPNPFPHYPTRFAKAPRYATPTQILPQSPPPTMAQMAQTSLDMFSSQPGSADNFGPWGPIHEDFEEPLPNRSNHFYSNNLSQSFRHLKLGPKQDKDVVIGEPSSSRRKRLQYLELYRFENYCKDWTVADRIRIHAPQHEIKEKVVREKSGIPIVLKMMNMDPIRRGQINRLLEMKNNDERDRDAEWVPVLIEEKEGRGESNFALKSVLAMNVIIAKTSKLGGPLTRNNLVVFADKKADSGPRQQSRQYPYEHRGNDNEDDKNSVVSQSQPSFLDDQSRISRRVSEQNAQSKAQPLAPKREYHNDSCSTKEEKPEIVEVTSGDSTIRQKAGITRQQPQWETTFCTICEDHPQGFYKEHELRRHIERHHSTQRKVWICKESTLEDGRRPLVPLSNCKACRSNKTYGANYNAAAHLRRAHFFPCKNKRGGRGKVSEGRGGMGGGDEPPMDELKNWMYEQVETNVAGNVLHNVDSVETSAIHGSFDSAKQLNSHNDAKSHPCPDGQPPAPTSLMSSEVDHGSSACTEGSARSISDDGGLSPQETNSDKDIDSDVSITGRTKRRVLENIMNEI
jgi:hypothetical protein